MVTPRDVKRSLVSEEFGCWSDVDGHVHLVVDCSCHVSVEYDEIVFATGLGKEFTEVFAIGVDVVDYRDVKLVVIFLQSGHHRRLGCVDIRAERLGKRDVPFSVEGAESLHHDPVAVACAWLEPSDADRVDLGEGIDSGSGHVIILRPVGVVEMSTVVRSELHPSESIDVRDPHYCKPVSRNILEIRSTHTFDG